MSCLYLPSSRNLRISFMATEELSFTFLYISMARVYRIFMCIRTKLSLSRSCSKIDQINLRHLSLIHYLELNNGTSM